VFHRNRRQLEPLTGCTTGEYARRQYDRRSQQRQLERDE
jgi:hypothetical protein